MSRQTKWIDTKSPYWFIIKFLLCFFVLYFFFQFYFGVTGKGGRFYSPFLDAHLNFIKGLTGFLVVPSKYVLQVLDYDVVQNNYHTLRIGHSRGISVNPSCLGWKVMSFWVAFVFANAGTWKHKLKWITAGLCAIIVLNITRIVLITLANHHKWKPITSLDHHDTFNVLSYGCIFISMFLYVRAQKKYEAIQFYEQPEKRTISSVQQ
ncbi:MAG TPA: exosortase/archaeosortase family protein [Segetibacter sp.]|jgi:exosortase/archaeosortase family protein